MTASFMRRLLPGAGIPTLKTTWIITRRELRDSLRDWRIITPILVLTVLFPWLMNWTAQITMDFVQKRNAPIIGERLIPFLLLIVGFFPITFSLVIALETFVGEKERRSIEPLLSMPITDMELYLGKMLSATVPPLIGSVLGISVYLGGLYWSIGYTPPFALLVQIFALTIAEALVMVAGAVVVSSQTTSVRAANLLASFIIIPMTLLVQAESVVMFWGDYNSLWTIVLALLIVMFMLIRMGVKTFNREEILGREIDELNLKRSGRLLGHFFVEPPGSLTQAPTTQTARLPRRLIGWVGRVYRHDLPYLLRHNWLAIAAVTLTLVVSIGVGWALVARFPLPQGTIRMEDLAGQDLQSMSNADFMPSLTTKGIFVHNFQALLAAGLLSIISLGAIGILLLMIPMGIIGFFAGQMAWLGYSPWVFIVAFILPHGVFEIPAAVIATAFALKLGASVTAAREGFTVGENLIAAVADFVKVFVFLVVPLLLVAAFLEAHLTPALIPWIYGG